MVVAPLKTGKSGLNEFPVDGTNQPFLDFPANRVPFKGKKKKNTKRLLSLKNMDVPPAWRV